MIGLKGLVLMDCRVAIVRLMLYLLRRGFIDRCTVALGRASLVMVYASSTI